MRRRLEPGEKNIKLSPGGTYDIDFVLSYLLIRNHSHETGGTLRDRIWRCVAGGLLDKKDGAELDHAAELTRTVDHVVRLVVGRALKWFPTTEHARATVEDLAAGILKRPAVTERELESALAQVRSVYKRVLATPE
jgi:glutamine synthetase adenylyltransferase